MPEYGHPRPSQGLTPAGEWDNHIMAELCIVWLFLCRIFRHSNRSGVIKRRNGRYLLLFKQNAG